MSDKNVRQLMQTTNDSQNIKELKTKTEELIKNRERFEK